MGADVGADVGEQVGAVAGAGDLRFEPREFRAVRAEDFAVTGEVRGFEGAGRGFGVQVAGELF